MKAKFANFFAYNICLNFLEMGLVDFLSSPTSNGNTFLDTKIIRSFEQRQMTF